VPLLLLLLRALITVDWTPGPDGLQTRACMTMQLAPQHDAFSCTCCRNLQVSTLTAQPLLATCGSQLLIACVPFHGAQSYVDRVQSYTDMYVRRAVLRAPREQSVLGWGA
jgi:hypothetical protein